MRVHEYRGKETGVMIMGSATELGALGKCLVEFAASSSEESDAAWPPMVATVNEGEKFLASIHHETKSKLLPEKSPSIGEAGRFILFATFFVLAVIGVISVVRWMSNVVF